MHYKVILYPVLSALAITISVFYCVPYLGLVSLVPLLYSIDNSSIKQHIIQTAIFSLVYTIFLFIWMLSSSTQFTGSILYGIAGLIISVLLFTVLFVGTFFIWRKLSNGVINWITITILASLFVLLEFLCDIILKTLPWYSFHFGNPLIGSVFTVQLAEVGGIYILTFFLFLINGGVAYTLKDKKQFKLLSIILLLFFGSNILLYNLRSNNALEKKEITINLINGNIPSNTDWELEGNTVVPQLISLSKQSADSPIADFNVWTESVVPWTYQKNDDFLNAILNNSSDTKTINLIGLNTNYDAHTVLNTVYAIKSNGVVIGKYDKVNPLIFMERPLSAYLATQFANNGYQVKSGLSLKPIVTEKGKIGVYICNEATIAPVVNELVKNGAEYLVNISNDGWFKNTYIARQHFYYNRLRAVENRRDVAINSNCGYSGKVSANGDIIKINQSNFPSINYIYLTKNTCETFYTLYPNTFILIIIFLTTTIILFKKS